MEASLKASGRTVPGLYGVVLGAGVVGVACVVLLPRAQSAILLPTLAAIALFVAFTMALKARVGDHLLGEIGFIYMVLALAYTIFPAFTFVVLDLDITPGWVWRELALLLPAPEELGLHLWRHNLFLFGVGASYLAVRGRDVPQMDFDRDTQHGDRGTILILFVVVLGSMLLVTLMSAPVTIYVDHYTRFDHLSWWPRKFVSLVSRMKDGFFFALMTLLFWNFRRYRWTTLVVVVSMAAYEIVYSYGSRIESLFILLAALCLFHHLVERVSLKKALVAGLVVGALFSVMEIFRAFEFDLSQTREEVSSRGFQPASEFGAVFFAGFHLYAERARGAIPPTEWPMFFNDFISLVTPNDFVRWHPQYWYARFYYPDDVVPPQTMGPIADSAIWGGEADLLIRSLVNGALFAWIVRWFTRHRRTWWAVMIYAFCYATSVMTLKYSVFYHLNPLFKTFLPMVLLVEVLRRSLRPGGGGRGSGASDSAAELVSRPPGGDATGP